MCIFTDKIYRFLNLSFTISTHAACSMPAPDHAGWTIFPPTGGQAEYLNVWGAGHQSPLLEVVMIR